MESSNDAVGWFNPGNAKDLKAMGSFPGKY
jgi:hypothetical protein